MLLRLATLAGAGYLGYRAYQARTQQDAAPDQPATEAGQEPDLSAPDPKTAVMPDGAEANEKIGARTIGDNG